MISPGQVIGRYRLLSELGRGGMGIVFEAEHVDVHSRVAIKLLQRAPSLHEAGVQRFLREARAAAQTKHLHAVSVIDVGTHADQWFIVMELLDGETLADLIAREAPLRKQRVAELLLPVIAAVMTAHEAGVIHRDLKPANIVLARRGRRIVHPVVTDFGISKLAVDTTADAITNSHSLLGTLHYMAPELTRAADRATPLSDQYSLGVILYECATGRRPFKAVSPYELMHAIVTGAFPPPRNINSALDAHLEATILRAMDRDPARRYPSVGALGGAVLACADQRTWAMWAPELAADTTLPRTIADDVDVPDATALGIQLASNASRSKPRQRVRPKYAMAAAMLVVCLAWLLLGRDMHQSHAYALPNDSSEGKAVVEREATRESAQAFTYWSGGFDPPSPVCAAAVGAVGGTGARPSRTNLEPRRVTGAQRTARRKPETPTAGTARSHGSDSSNLAPARGKTPEFGTNNAPILE